MRRLSYLILSLSILANLFGPISYSTAATLVASGTNPQVCNQALSSTTNVTSARSGQDCIITFSNTSEVTWTTPVGVTSVSMIVVGGGGGGGDSAAGATGGGGGAGGFFQNSTVRVQGDIAVKIGAGGSGSSLTSQGTSGGTSYFGTLKVGGGGGANGYNYVGGLRAGAGVGGTDFVSSGNGGGARPTGGGSYTNEIYGGLAGAYASAGVSFLGYNYVGLQGANGLNYSDGSSGGLGGYISEASRTSSISGTSTIYAKTSTYRPWEDALSTAGTKTPGSGGSPNYGYGTDPASTGGSGADGIVIIRYAISTSISSPTFSDNFLKGTWESATVSVNMPGKVRFYFENKRITGCLSVATSGTAPSLVATCTWKPAVIGLRTVHAVLTPDDLTFSAKTSTRETVMVMKRTNSR